MNHPHHGQPDIGSDGKLSHWDAGLFSDLGLPISLSGGDLTLNLTGAVSELLASLF
jgi:hypothetical protein